jgi:Protein of unknown function (DUF3800)
MYLCYVDECGNRDPRLDIPQRDGSSKPGDWLYVLTAMCIFEQRWHTLEKPINRHKLDLIERISVRHGVRLTLAETEVKSNWLRQPREVAKRLFLSSLLPEERVALADVYYSQLAAAHATIFAVLVDKRSLPNGTTHQDIHLRTWEQLLELVEQFMRARHDKHQAIMINDDVSREMNLMLAMNHAKLLDRGTQRETWLRHICEMPMFVRSELAVGVQLTDLCAYNIYRAFKTGDLAYPYFQRVAPHIWGPHDSVTPGKRKFSGLWVLDGSGSPLIPLVKQFENEQALAKWGQGL